MYVHVKVFVKVEVIDGEAEGIVRLKRELLPPTTRDDTTSVDYKFSYYAKDPRLEKLLQAANTKPVIEKIDELIETIEKVIHDAKTEG